VSRYGKLLVVFFVVENFVEGNTKQKVTTSKNQEIVGAKKANIQDCVSLHFSGHFPDGPGLAGTRMSPFSILLELRDVGGNDNWSYKMCIVESCSQNVAANKPTPKFIQQILVVTQYCLLNYFRYA